MTVRNMRYEPMPRPRKPFDYDASDGMQRNQLEYDRSERSSIQLANAIIDFLASTHSRRLGHNQGDDHDA